MKSITLLLAIALVSGCTKTKTASSNIGDEVVGTYRGFSGGGPEITVQVYKVRNQEYAIRKLSSASFPEFSFKYNLSLLGAFDYKVLPQANIITDSCTVGYFEVQKRLGFTLKDNTGTKFTYDGFK